MSISPSHFEMVRAILDTTDKFTERELKKTVRERDACQASELLGSPTRERLALIETIMAGK